jgi:hypothetical protein
MKDIIQRVVEAGSAIEHLEHTDWLYGSSPEELEELYRSFGAKFADALTAIRAEFGDPRYELPADREWFSRWYPEAFAAAAWQIKDGWLCLAAEHQDRDAPISLLIRSLTAQERDEFAE